MRKLIYLVLMMVLVAGCTPPGPLSEGEGPAHEALEGIDSLMWKQADSALKVMMEPKHGAAIPLQPTKKDGKRLDFVFFGGVKIYIYRL